MHSKMLQAMVVATLAAAPLAVLADSAPGEQKGDWLVRVGGTLVNPKPENLQPVGGGTSGIPISTLVVDSDVSLSADLTYMFHNNFGVELLAAYPFTHGIDAKPYAGGEVRVGYTDHLPPTLSLVWRPFDDKANVQPYVGVGVNYTMFFSEKFRGDTAVALGLPAKTDLRLDDSIGPAAVIGADFFPGEAKKWFLNANVRWIDIDTDAEVNVPGVGNLKLGTVEIDPMVYTIGFGRRRRPRLRRRLTAMATAWSTPPTSAPARRPAPRSTRSAARSSRR